MRWPWSRRPYAGSRTTAGRCSSPWRPWAPPVGLLSLGPADGVAIGCRPPSSATPQPASTEVPIGSGVTMRRDDVTTEVTVGQVQDPMTGPELQPAPGARVVSVLVRVHN